VKRNARRAEYDQKIVRDILDGQQICHVAYVHDGEPRIIATLYMCDGDHLYLHGNRQSALLRHCANGGAVSISVIAVDGVVVARSGFHCSMNYRSVTVFGCGEEVSGAEHRRALDEFVDALIPGHGAAVRAPTKQELEATAVVRVKLDEMSAKIRSGDPIDADGDELLDVWAGQIPLHEATLAPIASADLKAGIELPDYIRQFSRSNR
jgi:nitroimidazol reductase NimA-like FMN-containing flavoprotein (pyridoxamine 5'-phosphate oxidase superfamily)